MCNLSQGIKEAGIAEGKAAGIAEGKAAGIAEGKAAGIAEGKAAGIAEGKAEVITNMHNNGFTLEQIAVATGMDLSKIKAIITEKENIGNE